MINNIANYSNSKNDINLILCVDLNAVPNSACYKYITGNNIDCNAIDRRKVIINK